MALGDEFAFGQGYFGCEKPADGGENLGDASSLFIFLQTTIFTNPVASLADTFLHFCCFHFFMGRGDRLGAGVVYP